MSQKIKITAPAKINLFLHVIGKREDGYHTLQSLAAFANFGDEITITSSNEFKFSFDSTAEHLPTDENNLVICAANLLASELDKDLNCHIHLSKHIPIGAGLGGGSSDAAATIHGLLKFWNTHIAKDKLDRILLNLGADVPACYHAQACYFEGIGESITPINAFPPLPALLVYPNKHCATKDVFEHYEDGFSKEIKLPIDFENYDAVINFLSEQQNDLTPAATQNIEDIEGILNALDNQQDCRLSRMSGSGSACFGLFGSNEQAHQAAHQIQKANPDWWVRSVILS